MVEMTIATQQKIVQSGYGVATDLIAAANWAKQLFEEKHKEARRSRLRFWRRHEKNHLINLHPASLVQQKRRTQREMVSVERIKGSCGGRVNDFDARFRPRHRHNQERWQNVAMAVYQQKRLPPVELVKVDDVYFVQDGHHRLSVATSLGWEAIEANVTEWVLPRPV